MSGLVTNEKSTNVVFSSGCHNLWRMSIFGLTSKLCCDSNDKEKETLKFRSLLPSDRNKILICWVSTLFQGYGDAIGGLRHTLQVCMIIPGRFDKDSVWLRSTTGVYVRGWTMNTGLTIEAFVYERKSAKLSLNGPFINRSPSIRWSFTLAFSTTLFTNSNS